MTRHQVTPVEVTVSCKTVEEADAIGRSAVEQRLAASSQTWPIRSCYRWNGAVVQDHEHVLLMKTVDTHFRDLCYLIRSLHSYDLPSIVMIPLVDYGPGYLQWLLEAAGIAGRSDATERLDNIVG